MKTLHALSLLLALLGVAVQVGRHYQVWLYLPGLLMRLKVGPVGANEAVVWTAKQTAEEGDENEMKEGRRQAKPNIVLILADDLGFNDISFYGASRLNISTPNIDSLGRQGVSFPQAYAGHATCAPSRAALLTGRFASTVGYEYTPTHPAYAKILGTSAKSLRKGIYHEERAAAVHTESMNLPLSEVTVAQALRQRHNYSTLMIGKWHLGEDTGPTAHGFDQSLGFNLLSRYLPSSCEGDEDEGVEYRLPDQLDQLIWASARYQVSRNGEKKQFAPKGYLTDYFASEADAAITANKHNPFFLFLSLTSPHTPYQALRRDYDRLAHISDELTRVYAAMILSLDRAVGTVISSLQRNGLSDDTLVIFTNDNGAPSWSMQPDINRPFRGWKGSLFEGGIRVPVFMRWPGVIPPGSQVEAPMSHVDLFPTLLAAANLHSGREGGEEEVNPLSGVNLLPAILQKTTSPAPSSTGRSDSDGEGARSTSLLEQQPLSDRLLFWRSGHYMAIRRGAWKLQKAGNPDKLWLYDLSRDPHEWDNLATVEPYCSEVLPPLLTLLLEEDARQREPLWPSLTETAIHMDKLFETNESLDDEYVYWPN